jgi:hypothetical protein
MQMDYTKKVLAAAAFGLAGLMAIPASAQYYPQGNNGGWHDGDRNNGQYRRVDDRYYSHDSERDAYQQGYRDGIYDRQNGPHQRQRAWKHNYDANAYRDGYNEAYNGRNSGNGSWRNGNGRWGGRDNAGWRNRDVYSNGGYGNGGYGNGGYGRGYSRQGYIDGVNDGTRDAQTGHSFRPTEQPGYKHADRGREGSGLGKDEYKQVYRDAYMQGYQRGYYGNRRR